MVFEIVESQRLCVWPGSFTFNLYRVRKFIVDLLNSKGWNPRDADCSKSKKAETKTRQGLKRMGSCYEHGIAE